MDDIKSAILKKFSMVLDLIDDEETLETLMAEVNITYATIETTRAIMKAGEQHD